MNIFEVIFIYLGKEQTAGLVYDLRCCKMRNMESPTATTAKHPPMITAGWCNSL